MKTTFQRLLAVVLVTAGLLAATTSPASAASVWTGECFFNQWPGVSAYGLNHVEGVTGGVRFRSVTRSYGDDCAGANTQAPGNITTSVGVTVLNWTTGAEYFCGYIDSGSNGVVTWVADTGYTTLTNAQLRSLCSIPSGHVATVGAQSTHSVAIWPPWFQTGVVVSSTHAAAI